MLPAPGHSGDLGDVFHNVFRAEESSLAVLAVVRALAEMDELVTLDIRPIGEALATAGELAYVWALAGVYTDMSCQGRFLGEAFPAVIRTDVRALPGMFLHVSLETESCAEAAVTAIASHLNGLPFEEEVDLVEVVPLELEATVGVLSMTWRVGAGKGGGGGMEAFLSSSS
eukprot:CAMPEP_0167799634 /NCGR_PEP_ID=MMETSP0111_2-20121227/17167_1 /TAXON_ID=91324 /ORGANISM="Lotharella globosa, Strain CCCM811" /LENGTH=170 /DNA_ID=CAMNT_0007694569 /DNA_START=81 /DNA_END=595 /DNA_ORIENTATION=-